MVGNCAGTTAKSQFERTLCESVALPPDLLKLGPDDLHLEGTELIRGCDLMHQQFGKIVIGV
jgi:hypothetical protein